ncbi:MAG: hypothetical protein ACE5Q5_06215, partial [Nitrosarchaeum sp.]
IEITLTVHTDLGLEALEHVELNIGEEIKSISGVQVANNPVSIEWNKSFDGKTTVTVHDKQNLVKNVNVHVIDTTPTITFKFKFIPIQKFDTSTIVTKIWDDRKNVVSNHFYEALEMISYNKSDIFIETSNRVKSVIGDSEKPKKSSSIIDQINHEIQCKSDQQRLLRISDMSPVCVDAYQSSVLIAHNWAIPAR